MILDQSIGTVAVNDYFAVGWAWNWLSGESAGATIVGQWSNVLDLYSSNTRLELTSSNARLDLKSANERLEI